MCWNVNWTQPADGQYILRTANDIHVLTINMLKATQMWAAYIS